jgi:hypothetical protein
VYGAAREEAYAAVVAALAACAWMRMARASLLKTCPSSCTPELLHTGEIGIHSGTVAPGTSMWRAPGPLGTTAGVYHTRDRGGNATPVWDHSPWALAPGAMISASDRCMKITPRQIGLLHRKFPKIMLSTVTLPIVHVNSKVAGKMPRGKFMTSYGWLPLQAPRGAGESISYTPRPTDRVAGV